MNKTININLSGIIFHLDEDAYNLFKSYLTEVKTALESQEDREEIILDIEAEIKRLKNEWIPSLIAEAGFLVHHI